MGCNRTRTSNPGRPRWAGTDPRPIAPEREGVDRLLLAVAVVIIVPAVLVGYILFMEAIVRRMPGRSGARIRPWLWLAPAFAFLTVFLIYPPGHHLSQLLLEQRAAPGVRGYRSLHELLPERGLTAGAAEQHHLDGPADRDHGRRGARHRRPRRPGQVRAGGQDGHLPADGHQLRRCCGHLALRLCVRRGRRPAERRPQRRGAGAGAVA